MTYKLPKQHPERRQLQRLFRSDNFDRAHYAQLKRQILGRGSIFDATPDDRPAIPSQQSWPALYMLMVYDIPIRR